MYSREERGGMGQLGVGGAGEERERREVQGEEVWGRDTGGCEEDEERIRGTGEEDGEGDGG